MEQSPAAAARRAQIVQAAIETLAELGYAQTSFAKIAKRAGISSTRLISYHFAGKDDLIKAVAEEVLRDAAAFMHPRIEAASGHWGRMAAYIESNLDFLRKRPAHLRAVLEITGNVRAADGDSFQAIQNPGIALLEQGFRDGQRDGEYREFDPSVMAMTLRAAIDAVAVRYADHGVDLDFYTAQLVRTFELAIRKGATS